VRIAAAEEAEQLAARRWWWQLRVPAVAVTALAALVLVVVGQSGVGQRATREAPMEVAAGSAEPKPARERRDAPAAEVAEAPAAVAEAPETPPEELPAALTTRPDLFIDLPILRNLDKLEHFEQIETTTLDGQPRTSTAPETRRG
jgi:hypothetical protein